MNVRERQFEQVLRAFPDSARDHLRAVPGNAGKLASGQCKALLEMMGIAVEDLMVRLLPLAKLYAVTPISRFKVGAVANALAKEGGNEYDLYLGANIEFTAQALSQTVHAEQVATMNAWQQGAEQVRSVAVSAAPCGYCRQFLYEFQGSDSLMIITPAKGPRGFRATRLTELLPEAFGPRDLKKEAGLMAPSETGRDLTLTGVSEDTLVLEALSAAHQSYAPYTNNLAGCAIQVSDGQIYRGRYVENAAFNPSLSPLQAAISCMHMDRLADERTINRAVLVEKSVGSSQRGVTELVLRSCAPGVSLEYFEAL